MLRIASRNAFGRCLALAALALGVLGSQRAHAAGGESESAPSQPSAGVASAPSSAQRARVVLVAAVGADPELPALIRELLERQHVEADIERAPRFDPDALFAEQSKGTLGVFIALRGPADARLYFRAPGGERYLVRKLTLPSGLDAVGRELVGQVVASSAEALLGEAEALNREQASAEIASETPPPDAPPPPAPPAKREPVAPRNAAADGAKWELRFLARYSALWIGSDFGLRHGPGLALGARFGQRVLVGAELGGEYHFEQTFTTPDVTGHLRTNELHALFESGLRFGASSATLAAGPRLELSQFELQSATPSITPANPQSRTKAGLRLEGRHEWASRHFVLGLAALIDVAFTHTHYDLSTPNGTTEKLASVWPVRPGAVLSVGVR